MNDEAKEWRILTIFWWFHEERKWNLKGTILIYVIYSTSVFFVYRGCVPRFETRERVASGWRTRPADRFRFILLDYLQTSGAISVNPALPNMHFFSTFYLSGGSANHGLYFLCNGRQQAHETCLVIELMV